MVYTVYYNLIASKYLSAAHCSLVHCLCVGITGIIFSYSKCLALHLLSGDFLTDSDSWSRLTICRSLLWLLDFIFIWQVLVSTCLYGDVNTNKLAMMWPQNQHFFTPSVYSNSEASRLYTTCVFCQHWETSFINGFAVWISLTVDLNTRLAGRLGRFRFWKTSKTTLSFLTMHFLSLCLRRSETLNDVSQVI